MKIIKNGKEKTFFCKCTECATEFEYDSNDIFNGKMGELPYRMVTCHICHEDLCATLLTKEEFDFYKNFSTYQYFGCKA